MIRAIRNRVIARELEGIKEIGGIILPDKREEKNPAKEFEILSIGPIAKAGYPDLKEGMTIIATKYAHNDDPLKGTRDTFTLDADAILATLG